MPSNFRSDAAIVVPWRSTPEREHSFELAWRYNSEALSDFKVYFSDSVGERFNVSEARNRGCIQAIEDGYKVLIVIDADTVFERNGLVDALKVVTEQHVISYIYTSSVEPHQWCCEALDRGELQLHEVINHVAPSLKHVGSGWAMTSEMFWEMNGWDENFIGWGYEDTAFQKAYELLFSSEMLRVPGTCYRLYHSVRDAERLADNMLRYDTCYSKPEITPEDIRQLITGNMVHRLTNEVG